MIIFPDVDLDRAEDSAIVGMNFAWQGQSCGSKSRVLVHDDTYETIVERITARAAAIKVGDPMSMETGMGPVNSAKAYAHVTSFLDLKQLKGAQAMTGGKRPNGAKFAKGYWVEPTVVADVTPSTRLFREEVSGPILSIIRWSDYEQMIAMANDTEYGLSPAHLPVTGRGRLEGRHRNGVTPLRISQLLFAASVTVTKLHQTVTGKQSVLFPLLSMQPITNYQKQGKIIMEPGGYHGLDDRLAIEQLRSSHMP